MSLEGAQSPAFQSQSEDRGSEQADSVDKAGQTKVLQAQRMIPRRRDRCGGLISGHQPHHGRQMHAQRRPGPKDLPISGIRS